MAESRIFKVESGITIEGIGQELLNFFRNKKQMFAEGMETPEGYLVQSKEEQSWKKFTGMDQATQVQIFQNTPETITVSVGTGTWVDKAAAAGVGAIVFAPLLATAAFGAFKQQKLPSEIFDCIEYYIRTGGKSVTVTMETNMNQIKENKNRCHSCDAVNAQGTKFCSSCGENLMDLCPGCQNSVDFGTKFCPECGFNLEKAKIRVCTGCNEELVEGTKFCSNCGSKAPE